MCNRSSELIDFTRRGAITLNLPIRVTIRWRHLSLAWLAAFAQSPQDFPKSYVPQAFLLRGHGNEDQT
jgi:hypothetical protein